MKRRRMLNNNGLLPIKMDYHTLTFQKKNFKK